jgi:hypothetical protein
MLDININRYLEPLATWSGYELNVMEDFNVICQCDLDFLELLLLGEKEFSVNMLDNTRSREDFSTIKDFLIWAVTNPPAPIYITY